MKRKRRLYATICLFFGLVLLLLLILFQKLKNRTYDTTVWSENYVAVDEVKQELSFGVYEDIDWDVWFLPYHRNYLTGEMLTQLLEQLGLSDYIEQTDRISKRTVVTHEQWDSVYGQILKSLDMKQEVQTDTLLVVDRIEAADGLVLITNNGDYTTALPDSYFENWKAYEIYRIDGICVGVRGAFKEEQEIPNVYVKNITDGTVSFLFSGASYEKTGMQPELEVKPGVCDLIFKDGELSGIRRKQDTIEGDMISYDEDTIEIRGYGKIRHSGKLPVYRTYGDVTEKSISDVVLGNMVLEYVTAGDEVCAILIREPASIQSIRVLLLAEDGTKFHSDVYLKSDTDASAVLGEETWTAEAGEVLHITGELTAGGEVFSLTPEGSGKTYLCDADGNLLSNGYYGVMEVRAYEDGYTLVNQLPFEQYLYAVVPSEMPVSYAPEALKAQAVCARSYAYIQLLKGSLAAFGAHMDDSTSYQVYNKVAETEESIQAVDETHGQVLAYEGNVLEAYYFSTSAGYTDTSAVWNDAGNPSYGYLHKFCLNMEEYDGNLADEDGFRTYIQSTPDGYDSDVRYYRWQITADYSDKTDAVNQILTERKKASPETISYLKKDGKTEAEKLSDFGSLKKISVEERSDSGCILTLKITYKRGVVLVKTEYNIRKILGVGALTLTFSDGSEGTPSALLPSAFTTVEKQKDGTYLLSGGGYGHGLGMSQNGANGMAKAGMSYQEILRSFYQNIEITDMEEKGDTR